MPARGGVDLLFDAAGGQTRDRAVGAVRDGGRAILVVLAGPPAQLEREAPRRVTGRHPRGKMVLRIGSRGDTTGGRRRRANWKRAGTSQDDHRALTLARHPHQPGPGAL